MKAVFREVKTINEFIDAIRLRVDVFIKEQGFAPGWEPDENDKISRQFISAIDRAVVATARFRESSKGEIKIERMAVSRKYRGKGIGQKLLRFMIKEAIKQKPKRIWMQSQLHAKPFYEMSEIALDESCRALARSKDEQFLSMIKNSICSGDLGWSF